MKEETYELLVLAPVPVGHHVEINWYRKQVKGIITGVKWEEFPYNPIIKDLDSGVVYGTFDFFWEHGSGVAIDMDKPSTLSKQVLPQLERQYAIKGKVTACRVATYDMGIGLRRLFKVQTSLTVECETT